MFISNRQEENIRYSISHFLGLNDDAVMERFQIATENTTVSILLFNLFMLVNEFVSMGLSCSSFCLFVCSFVCLFSLFFILILCKISIWKAFQAFCLPTCQVKCRCCPSKYLLFYIFFGPWLLICWVTIEQKCICGLKFSHLSTEAFRNCLVSRSVVPHFDSQQHKVKVLL